MSIKFIVGKSYKYTSTIPNPHPHNQFYVLGVSSDTDSSITLAIYWLTPTLRSISVGHIELSPQDREVWMEIVE